MTKYYLEAIAAIRNDVSAGMKTPEDILRALDLAKGAESRARSSQEEYLASKFHGLAAELDYLVQLHHRNRAEHLGDRYDIIIAECSMIETHIANR